MIPFDINSSTLDNNNKDKVVIEEPTVLEVSGNKIFFYSEIDRSSILTLNKTITNKSSGYMAEQADYQANEPYPIYLHINSYGGGVFQGLAGMDRILAVRKDTPINTVIDGCCASAATLLSIVGSKRYIYKHAFMLIHQLSSFSFGKYYEIKDNMDNLDRIMDILREIYLEYTKIPKEKLEEILKHDLWFDAKQCYEYGLVDAVLG